MCVRKVQGSFKNCFKSKWNFLYISFTITQREHEDLSFLEPRERTFFRTGLHLINLKEIWQRIEDDPETPFSLSPVQADANKNLKYPCNTKCLCHAETGNAR